MFVVDNSNPVLILDPIMDTVILAASTLEKFPGDTDDFAPCSKLSKLESCYGSPLKF